MGGSAMLLCDLCRRMPGDIGVTSVECGCISSHIGGVHDEGGMCLAGKAWCQRRKNLREDPERTARDVADLVRAKVERQLLHREVGRTWDVEDLAS